MYYEIMKVNNGSKNGKSGNVKVKIRKLKSYENMKVKLRKFKSYENMKMKKEKQSKKVKPPGTEEKIEVSPCKSLGKEKVDCLY